MRPGDRGPALALAVCLLPLIGAPDPARAQDTLALGQTLEGTLEPGDSTDVDGYLYDVVRLDPGDAHRVWILLESDAFDPYMQLAVVTEGGWTSVAEQQESPVPGSGGAGLYVPVRSDPWAGEALAVLASSVGEGKEGAYTLRLTEAPAGDTAVSDAIVPGRIRGALSETDAMEYLTFRDRYRVRGDAGRRLLVGMTGDLDPYLYFRRIEDGEPVEVARDDDSWGGTDAFLEVELEDGEYELVASSYSQAFGEYELEIWDAPPLVPAIGSAPDAEADAAFSGLAVTEEEKEGLVIDDGVVRNELLGFRFPAPGPNYFLSPMGTIALSGTELPANTAAWMIQPPGDELVIVIMAFKAVGPVAESTFSLMAEGLIDQWQLTIVGDDWQDVSPPASDWTTRSLQWSVIDPTPEGLDAPSRIDLWCEASGPERTPGLVVCLAGISVTEGSLMDTLKDLEIDTATPSP
ncbi:MAG: hypothetical protein R3314_01035 [Longimicrobiales bacterium]|nr:hypothetical protein [Longimicrobiales bacterium]